MGAGRRPGWRRRLQARRFSEMAVEDLLNASGNESPVGIAHREET
jgi:hypothetical protein